VAGDLHTMVVEVVDMTDMMTAEEGGHIAEVQDADQDLGVMKEEGDHAQIVLTEEEGPETGAGQGIGAGDTETDLIAVLAVGQDLMTEKVKVLHQIRRDQGHTAGVCRAHRTEMGTGAPRIKINACSKTIAQQE